MSSEQSLLAGPSPMETGVLLVNLGSPDSPTTPDVRRYLAEFLWDPRLVDLPRSLWWFILHAFILPFRPARSARAYAHIWTPEGSPLVVTTRRQAERLQQKLRKHVALPIHVVPAMRYGTPSIRSGMEVLRQKSCARILVLPLYPQNSSTTTASVVDAVAETLRGWRRVPEIRMISDFHDDAGYNGALARSVREVWQASGPSQKLLVSYHGLPKRYVDEGDPYLEQCRRTTELFTEEAGLAEDQWMMTFQSRFGREEWIRPYTDQTLRELASAGVSEVDVICPGFAADCLETLEEIALTNQTLFLTSGGKRYRYIPALNDRPDFMDALTDLCFKHLSGWPGFPR